MKKVVQQDEEDMDVVEGNISRKKRKTIMESFGSSHKKASILVGSNVAKNAS